MLDELYLKYNKPEYINPDPLQFVHLYSDDMEIAGFIASSKADANVSAISGLTSVLDLIAYGFAFGLVGLGVGMVYYGFKE